MGDEGGNWPGMRVGGRFLSGNSSGANGVLFSRKRETDGQVSIDEEFVTAASEGSQLVFSASPSPGFGFRAGRRVKKQGQTREFTRFLTNYASRCATQPKVNTR